jgi:hypothetical protein
MLNFNSKRPLTWNGGFLYVVANPLPCWSLVQSQLPHVKNPPGPTPSPFSPLPANTSINMHTDDINTLWYILSGTVTIHADNTNMPKFLLSGTVSLSKVNTKMLTLFISAALSFPFYPPPTLSLFLPKLNLSLYVKIKQMIRWKSDIFACINKIFVRNNDNMKVQS